MRKKFDREHLLSLCEPGDYGIFAPPMKAQVALDELCHYFLGDDWCSYSGCTNTEQINTEIVATIEQAYPGCKIDNKKHQAMSGKLPIEKLKVGTVFMLGNRVYKKLNDSIIHGRLPKHQGNTLCLDNGHHITMRTDLWVLPLDSEEVAAMKSSWKGDTPLAQVPIGATVRFFNKIGIKVADSRTTGDWMKHPQDFTSNFLDVEDYKLKTVSANIMVQVLDPTPRQKVSFATLKPGTLFVWGDTVGLKVRCSEGTGFEESVFIDMANNHAAAVNIDITVLPIKEGVYHEGFTYKT